MYMNIRISIERNYALQWAQHGPALLFVNTGRNYLRRCLFWPKSAKPNGRHAQPRKPGTSVGFRRLWPCIELVRRALVTRIVTRRTSKKDQEGRRHREISRIWEQLAMRSMPGQTTRLRRLR